MPVHRLVVIMAMLLICVVSILSADDLPILDGNLIFMDTVHIIEQLPFLDAFNDDDTIHYFDPEKQQWQIYDYPPEATLINFSEQRSDGTYLLVNNLSEGDLLHNWIDQTWIFDPNTGAITRPDEQCGVAQDLPDEGRWIYFRANDGLVYLCHTETGELSTSLPDDVQDIIPVPCRVEMPSVSPDKQTVVFSDCNTSGEKSLYSYDIITQVFTKYLNTVNHSRWQYHIWLDNNTFLSIGESSYAQDHDVYLTHVDQPESLQHIAYQYSVQPYLNTKAKSPFLIWTDTGELVGQYNDDHLIVKVDLLTGDQTTLFTKDCSGYLEDTQYYYCFGSEFSLNPYNEKYIALLSGYSVEGITIIDIESQSILYQAYTKTNTPFAWLDETTFVYDDDEDFTQEQQSFMMISITDDGVVETPLLNTYTYNAELSISEQAEPQLSPNGRYILSYEYLTNRKYYPTRLSIYDVLTQTRYPITHSITEVGYGIYASWNDDNTLNVNIYESLNKIGSWTVSIEN